MIKTWTVMAVFCLGLVVGLNVGDYYGRESLLNGTPTISRWGGYYQIFPMTEKDYWKLRAISQKGGWDFHVNWYKTKGGEQ